MISTQPERIRLSVPSKSRTATRNLSDGRIGRTNSGIGLSADCKAVGTGKARRQSRSNGMRSTVSTDYAFLGHKITREFADVRWTNRIDDEQFMRRRLTGTISVVTDPTRGCERPNLRSSCWIRTLKLNRRSLGFALKSPEFMENSLFLAVLRRFARNDPYPGRSPFRNRRDFTRMPFFTIEIPAECNESC